MSYVLQMNKFYLQFFDPVSHDHRLALLGKSPGILPPVKPLNQKQPI